MHCDSDKAIGQDKEPYRLFGRQVSQQHMITEYNKLLK
jgi:hypothetical protein